jgi:hypothetical protein
MFHLVLEGYKMAIEYSELDNETKEQIEHGFHYLKGGVGYWVDGEDVKKEISKMKTSHLKNIIGNISLDPSFGFTKNANIISIIKTMIEEKLEELNDELFTRV